MLFMAWLFSMTPGIAQNVPRQYVNDMAKVHATHSSRQFHMNTTVGVGINLPAILQKMAYNPESAYIITFKDSTQKQVLAKINFEDKKVFLMPAVSKAKKDTLQKPMRIYPNQTLSILAVDPAGVASSVGIANDSCWLFTNIKGRINAYSYLPKPFTGKIGEDFFQFIQKDGGPIQPFSPELLKDLVSDNEKSKLKLNVLKYYEAMVVYNKEKK